MNPRVTRTDLRIVMGGLVALVLLTIGLLVVYPSLESAIAIDISRRLLPPSSTHWCGTDALGRDIFSAILIGSRTTLGIAFGAVSIGAGIGVPLGLYSALREDVTDAILTRFNDLLFAFPSLILATLFAVAIGPGSLATLLAIAVFNIPVFARVARSSGLVLARQDFVSAARLAGAGRVRIAVHHLLPNVLPMAATQGAVQLSLAIVAEAGLSYVGLGVQPPAPSWGRMLGEAQTFFATAPWLALFPGLAIALTVLGVILIGDHLRRTFSVKVPPS
jgi:peptide/nickel transport system permease protein